MKKHLILSVTALFVYCISLAQNTGIGTNAPTNTLHVVSASDTAIFAVTGSTAPLTPAVLGYSNSNNDNQIGVMGKYNGTGYGTGIAGIGYLGNMPPASVDIGVFASQHTATGRALVVDGAMQLTDGSQGKGYVLTSDAAGVASWQKPTAGQHAFAAGCTPSTINIPANTDVTIPFDYTDYDAGSDFAGGTFTAPDTGVYHFDGSITWSLSSSTTDYVIHAEFLVTQPGVLFGDRVVGLSSIDLPAITGGDYTQQIGTDIHLNTGNTVSIHAYHNASVQERIWGTISNIFSSTPYSRFTGHKLF